MARRSSLYDLVGCLASMGALALSGSARAQFAPPPAASGQLPDVLIEAPEPRFVAPTRRDKIGRIWAPVTINGKGPFRLVRDTGAGRSAAPSQRAEILGIN